jgi:hypothetical protein
MSAAIAVPAWAADGDALQSHENQHGNQIERNAVTTPPSEATPTPAWDGRRTYSYDRSTSQGSSAMSLPGSTLRSPGMSAESAAQESHATGKVDADQAAPPQTGADVQPGDMGPSSAKAQ